jgi:1,4-alpha-glucan branching enzyme
LRDLNDAVHHYFPDALMFAEESTSWGGVTKPTSEGGLGFDYKWDMGWMHDTLDYFAKDPIHRQYHQNSITFRGLYMFSEQFCLPLSHDEVVHGKQAIISKMPGDMWQQFANVRALYGYQWAQPGKKLLFMGCEFGQWDEWSCQESVDWHLTQWESHRGIQNLIKDLNALYSKEPALHQRDTRADGYYMIDCQDAQHSVMSFGRRGHNANDDVIIVCNFTPTVHNDYRVGVPQLGLYTELLNTDATLYGGSGQLNTHAIHAEHQPCQSQPYSIQVKLPPLGVMFLKRTAQS